MEKDFVLYDEALALRELGFNEPCFAVHPNKVDGIWYIKNENTQGDYVIVGGCPQKGVSAPTYSHAFRWFRNKHSLYININTETNANEILGMNVAIVSWRFFPINLGGFETHEDAELVCLRELIKIVGK